MDRAIAQPDSPRSLFRGLAPLLRRADRGRAKPSPGLVRQLHIFVPLLCAVLVCLSCKKIARPSLRLSSPAVASSNRRSCVCRERSAQRQTTAKPSAYSKWCSSSAAIHSIPRSTLSSVTGLDSRWLEAKFNFGAVRVRFFQLGLEAARQGVHEAETHRTLPTTVIDCVGRKARASIGHANFDVVTLSPSCDWKRSGSAFEGVFLRLVTSSLMMRPTAEA